MKPLEGVRVLAVSQYGAGPYGSLQLADLGAEVIKIEDRSTGGDVSRSVIPFAEEGDSLYFQAFNRNKKSITLDLKSPEGFAVFEKLVAKADAVFCNLRGDVPEKLGLKYDRLKAINPAIVVCALTGYGTTGSKKREPAYDYLLQAALGHMALTGTPGEAPEKYGVSMIDFSTGLLAAFALVSGILRARTSGEGGDVEVTLYDTAASLLNYLAIWTLNREYEPKRTKDSAHPSLVPSQMFATADGYLVVMCNKEKFYRELVVAMGRPEWADDPRFISFGKRLENKEELLPLLATAFKERKTEEWLACLQGKVPVAPVRSVEDALQDPFLREREMIAELQHPEFGSLKTMGVPVKFSGFKPDYSCAPKLGEHTREVLESILEMSPEEITDLQNKGIL